MLLYYHYLLGFKRTDSPSQTYPALHPAGVQYFIFLLEPSSQGEVVDYLGEELQFTEMTSNKYVDKLSYGLEELIIGASGNIPGYSHGILSPYTSEASYSVD